jgi:type IV pilus assembly protein PilM
MANPFSDITDSISGLLQGLGKTSDTVVGIDIGASSVKVVQLKKERGKIVLQTYGEVATGPYDNMRAGQLPNLQIDQLQTVITDIIKEANVSTKVAALSIQASASLLFVLNLPQMSDKELEKVIPNEARKYIPIPMTEVSLDWWPIPRQEYIEDPQAQNNREVLVVAIRKETIGQYNDLIRSVGFSSSLLEVEIFSAIRSSFHHELQPTMIVDFGASSTRIAIVEYGVVKIFHTINRGSHYISQSLATSLGISFESAEKMKKDYGMNNTENPEASAIVVTAVNYIFSEMNSVLLNYQREYHQSIGKMILVGGGSRLNGFYERAQREFQFDVVFGDPFSKAQSPEFLHNVLRESGPEFAIATGLALKQLQ